MQELFNLKGKTAIITGGGRGLGKQMATALAKAGANLVLCSRKVEACEAACKEFAEFGVRCLPIQCDVTKADDIQKVIEQTVDTFGTIDILINNSGTSWAATKGILDKSKHPLQAHIPAGRFGSETDLMGPILFLTSKASDYITGHTLVVDGGGGKGLMIQYEEPAV